MAPLFGPGVNEDGSGIQRQAQVRARQEHRRRAVLYNVSSSTGQRLPSVSLQPEDARMRRDLLRLTQQLDQRVESEKKSVYEEEQSDCKHRDHLCYRPTLDHIQQVRDLHTTVAKDPRGRVKPTTEERKFAKTRLKSKSSQNGAQQSDVKPEWRLGYSNNVDTGSRAGVPRTFEPRDTTRERILDSRSAPVLLPDSVAVAYPVKSADINLNDPNVLTVDNQVDSSHDVSRDSCQHGTKKKSWCPASSSGIARPKTTTSPRRRYHVDRFASQSFEGSSEVNPEVNCWDHDGLQRFPIRSIDQFDPLEDTEENIAMNARYARKQQTLMTKVAGTFSRVRARVDRMKDPQLRYELPIEDTQQNHPAYRLGLDPVPSTRQKQSERPRFRPKSAGTTIGFQIGQRGPKAGDMLKSESNGVAKVAGARLRPHSASITHFRNSTVFCMGPPTAPTTNCASASTDFRSVLAVESQKRQRDRESILQKLATRGLLHSIPLAQVFARLRREALHNVERRMQHSVFERMTLEEYMSACGCIHTPPTAADKKQHSDSPGSPIKEIRRFSINLPQSDLSESPSVDASPSLLATRKSLVVSRQQFHLALEAFNLSSLDVNQLFTALDVAVSDSVQIWDAMCAVEVLQHEHTALRRARVQQLQAPPTKDLDFFRRHNT